MQQSSQKYSKYHKSFDRAFNTKQDGDMIDLESARLPSLQTGELVTIPIDNGNKAVKNSENVVAECGIVSNETLHETHLKPVVIRGTAGLNFDRKQRVRLPPINVNLQVRDLLVTNDRSQKTAKASVTQYDSTLAHLSIRKKKKEKSLKNSNSHHNLNKAVQTRQPNSSENNGKFYCSRHSTTQRSKNSSGKFNFRTDCVERAIAMKEYTVLPPIRKHVHLPEPEEAKNANKNETKNALSEIEDIGNGDKDSFDLGEALEHLAKEYHSNYGIQPTGHGNNEEGKRSEEQANGLKIQPSLNHKNIGTYNDGEFTAIDNTLQNVKVVQEKDPSLQAYGKQGSKRHQNYYSDGHIQDENERRHIRKMRKQGRRFAICEEMDPIYRDLAVIVKHNLLIQHLEEICIF